MENVKTTMEMAMEQAGIHAKEESTMPQTIHGEIDMTKEFSLIPMSLAMKALYIKDSKSKKELWLGKDQIIIRTSRRGFKYFLVKGEYITGPVRMAIMEYLWNQLQPEYIGKLGKYEVSKGEWNQRSFMFLVDTKEGGLRYIATPEWVNEQGTKLEYAKLREENIVNETKPRSMQVSDEIYGDHEAGLGYRYISGLLDQLEISKEVIMTAMQSGHPEVKIALEELKDLLCNE